MTIINLIKFHFLLEIVASAHVAEDAGDHSGDVGDGHTYHHQEEESLFQGTMNFSRLFQNLEISLAIINQNKLLFI